MHVQMREPNSNAESGKTEDLWKIHLAEGAMPTSMQNFVCHCFHRKLWLFYLPLPALLAELARNWV